MRAFNRKTSLGCLYDRDSTNGTFLDDSRVEEPTLLSHGDTLRFGPIRFRVTEDAGLELFGSAEIHRGLEQKVNQTLSNRLLNPDFLSLMPVSERKSKILHMEKLMVKSGRKGNYIKIVNDIVPQPFAKTRDSLGRYFAIFYDSR